MPAIITPIIAHERIAEWTGRLRPRLAADPRCRWLETRSTADLVAAVRPGPSGGPWADPVVTLPVVLINLAARPHWGLESLLALRGAQPDALVLVLDPDRTPEVSTLARELGADLVCSGVAVPPRVEALLRVWVDRQQDRARPNFRRCDPAPSGL